MAINVFDAFLEEQRVLQSHIFKRVLTLYLPKILEISVCPEMKDFGSTDLF